MTSATISRLGAFASLAVMGAATGATQSKYVARRETPVYIAENCTQCMECITACPDTALPNTAQDISTVLVTAIRNYVSDKEAAKALLNEVAGLDERCRAKMNESVASKTKEPFKDILRAEVDQLTTIDEAGRSEFLTIIDKLPLAYNDVTAIWRSVEKKNPGNGGLFSIFVSDLCKGCGECVQACGDHDALRMTAETPDLNAELTTAQVFSRLLPDTTKNSSACTMMTAPRPPAKPPCAITSWCAATTRRLSQGMAPAPVAGRRACYAPQPQSPRRTCDRCITRKLRVCVRKPRSWKPTVWPSLRL